MTIDEGVPVSDEVLLHTVGEALAEGKSAWLSDVQRASGVWYDAFIEQGDTLDRVEALIAERSKIWRDDSRSITIAELRNLLDGAAE